MVFVTIWFRYSSISGVTVVLWTTCGFRSLQTSWSCFLHCPASVIDTANVKVELGMFTPSSVAFQIAASRPWKWNEWMLPCVFFGEIESILSVASNFSLPMVAVADAWVKWQVASVAVCVIRILKEKWLELSTPNLVHIYSMAGLWHTFIIGWLNVMGLWIVLPACQYECLGN